MNFEQILDELERETAPDYQANREAETLSAADFAVHVDAHPNPFPSSCGVLIARRG